MEKAQIMKSFLDKHVGMQKQQKTQQQQREESGEIYNRKFSVSPRLPLIKKPIST